MYVPEHFSETRIELLHALIAGNPMGVLVTQGRGGLDALVGKAKLSQNRETCDIRSAGEALKALGENTIGEAMLACAAGRRE
ncbi:MAG: FMN-binding negative transcriptional regulator [Azonexus sp.]